MMVRSICSSRPGDKISAKEFRTILELNSMRECSQDR